MELTLLILSATLLGGVALLLLKIKSLYYELEQIKSSSKEIIEKERKSAISQSRSVLIGNIKETLAPFTSMEYDPTRMVFIGKPIDYIFFGDDKICFIEKCQKLIMFHRMKTKLINC